MTDLKYVARKGYRISNRDAAIVGPALEKIPKKKRTASHVVGLASKSSSPLHRFFEWNNSVAAREHRLHQARILFQSYTIVEYDNGRKMRELPRMISFAYATKQRQKESYYVTLDELSEDEALAEQYLDTIISDIVALANQHEVVRKFVKMKRGDVAKQLRNFFAVADGLSRRRDVNTV